MLELPAEERKALWARVSAALEEYAGHVAELAVSPPAEPEAVRAALAELDFDRPLGAAAAVDWTVDQLRRFQVHTPHPRYFGLFNPAPTTMGIAADTLVAGFNPQLAAWSHNPFAAEVERLLIQA